MNGWTNSKNCIKKKSIQFSQRMQDSNKKTNKAKNKITLVCYTCKKIYIYNKIRTTTTTKKALSLNGIPFQQSPQKPRKTAPKKREVKIIG